MSEIQCFFLEPTEFATESLRRYSGAGGTAVCLGKMGYHNATVPIAQSVPYDKEKACGDNFPHDDPRWPKKCDYCEYQFQDSDEWQHNHHQLYARKDTGQMYPLLGIDTPPVGAMWNAPWYFESIPYVRERSPDGMCLVVRTPGGDWIVDTKSSNGPGWTRAGAPPNVTANPSIAIGDYHGWLRDGKLVAC